MEAKTKLVTTVLASFVEGKFYQSQDQAARELQETVRAVLDIDPEFVLKLAAYARNVMHLRSVPIFLLNEFANSGRIVNHSRKYVTACIGRADEITELLALSLESRKELPGQKPSQFILKGLAPAFNKFDEYQFAKYNRDGDVTLKDALFLTHPVAKNEGQQYLFDAIANETLETPDTWEVAISENGATKESWEAILPKMGYMALMRNLNGMLRNGVNPELILPKLTDPVAIQKSKQYPFRYYSAYKAIKDAGYMHDEALRAKAIMDGLNKAMDLSVANIPKIPGNSLVLLDVSGSMTWRTISAKSKVTPAEIARVFGAISSTVCDHADIIVFADQFGAIHFKENEGILQKMATIAGAHVGGGTEAHLPIDFCRKMKLKYDRVFLFSDMQCYTQDYYSESFAKSFTLYQREVAPTYLYSVDLVGYGTAVVPQDQKKVLLLSGFSEKLFEFIPRFETNRETLIQDIEDYKV
jgi:60 kDa SS-A/Ro ribonucleoprotein